MELMKGSEPYSHISSSPVGVLVIHGFTGTASSMMPLAKAFAAEGWNVELPRLTGHGTDWRELNRVSYKNWLQDVDEAYEKLVCRTEVILTTGLSMGGSIALLMAEMHPEIRGVSVINNAYFVDSPLVPFLPLLRHILAAVPAISSDIKNPAEKEIAYDVTPVGGIHELAKLLNLVRKAIPGIKQPALIFKSRQDHVLPVANAVKTYDKIGSKDKELVWLENSYHVATQDFESELIIHKTMEFFRKLTKSVGV